MATGVSLMRAGGMPAAAAGGGRFNAWVGLWYESRCVRLGRQEACRLNY